MGGITCGFWKIKFILCPDEFRQWLAFCETQGVRFDGAISQLGDDYEAFYRRYTHTEALPSELPHAKKPCCGLQPPYPIFGFHLVAHDLWFFWKEAWVRDALFDIQLSYQKAVAIDKEDDKGKYFEYEDILIHQPQGFPIWDAISSHIKQQTRPLRFSSPQGDEIKPTAVRISEKVANDLARSAFFVRNGFQMRSYAKRNKAASA